MIQLRREYLDGPERPELVLIHYSILADGPGGRETVRTSLVVPPSGDGRREVLLYLPEPPRGERYALRYFFSTVRDGSEHFSPRFEIPVPGDKDSGDVSRPAGPDGANVPPAPGRSQFRLVLPMRADRPGTGTVHYGFGAMRKKPSHFLCREALLLDGGRPPVAEVPETLAVLKNRPMPFFLYHYVDGAPDLHADKIAPVRVALEDAAGDVVCARVLWADAKWAAQNINTMEARNFPIAAGSAADDFFAEDRGGYLAARMRALAGLPLPRTFEAFVFGASGRVIEYCFQVLRRTADGVVASEWRHCGGGGNWRVTV
jgi:hypothetical protein